jgi:ribosomal protein L11 methylase PrmA
LSGILDEQAEEVAAAYQRWFDMKPVAREERWALLEGERR